MKIGCVSKHNDSKVSYIVSSGLGLTWFPASYLLQSNATLRQWRLHWSNAATWITGKNEKLQNTQQHLETFNVLLPLCWHLPQLREQVLKPSLRHPAFDTSLCFKTDLSPKWGTGGFESDKLDSLVKTGMNMILDSLKVILIILIFNEMKLILDYESISPSFIWINA